MDILTIHTGKNGWIVNKGLSEETFVEETIHNPSEKLLAIYSYFKDGGEISPSLTKEENKKLILTKEVEEITTKQTKNAYSMIAGREVSDAQRGIYESKGWLAEVVSRRNPKKLSELALVRLGADTEENIDLIVEDAKDDFETPFLEHIKENPETTFNTIELYANYIVEVGIFWKKAEGSMLSDIGAVKNKMLRMLHSGRLLEVESILPSLKNLKADKTLTSPLDKLASIKTQVKQLLAMD